MAIITRETLWNENFLHQIIKMQKKNLTKAKENPQNERKNCV
jgi:hypothetical protein